jgi:hypothetical protein
MHPEQYLGWLALALTPGLGARMAGKLLREMGSPDAIFNALLTELEAQRLPAAVAQALHTRQPLSAAAKNWPRPRPPVFGCSPGTNPSIRGACAKFTILRLSSMCAETLNF